MVEVLLKRLACGSTVLVLILGGSSATLAQSAPDTNADAYAETSPAVPDIMINHAKGSTPVAQPGPGNAVPSWAQESYNVYLQMKAKAHGGTVHDANHMPDWSGLWSPPGSEGTGNWDAPPAVLKT